VARKRPEIVETQDFASHAGLRTYIIRGFGLTSPTLLGVYVSFSSHCLRNGAVCRFDKIKKADSRSNPAIRFGCFVTASSPRLPDYWQSG
jgi:hypothetical protein